MVASFIGGALSALGGNLVNKVFGGSSSAKSSWTSSLSNAKALTAYEMKLANNYNNQFLSNSAKTTLALNKSIMDYQYGLERESRQNSYVDTRKDLEKAGFNPLLAVGQQSGYTAVGSGVGAESPQQEAVGISNSAVDSMSKFSDMYNSSRMTTGNLQQIASDILSSNYINDLHSAQTELTHSQTRGQDIQNMVDNQTKLDQALSNLDLTKQQKLNLKQDLAESQARILKYNYENLATSAQTELMNQQKIQQEAFTRFSRKHPVAGGAINSGALNTATGIGTALLHGMLLKGKVR